MQDPRIQKLAQQLVQFSTNLKAGEKVLIDLAEVPDEIGIALVREAREVGAIPFLRIGHAKLNREMLMGATAEQYAAIAEHQLTEMKDMADQNRRLKKMYAEMSMQNDLLKEALGKKR